MTSKSSKFASSVTWCSSFLLVTAGMGLSQIEVGIGGVSENFTTRPPGTRWAGGSLAGSNTTISNFATMNTAVQPLNAATFTTQLASTTGGVGVATAPLWHDAGVVLTPPTGVAANVVMGRFVNKTAKTVQAASLSWSLGLLNNNVDAPDTPYPNHFIWVSRTGAPNSWEAIGNIANYFGSAANPPPTAIRAGFDYTFTGGWPPEAPFYVIWVDDNSSTTEGLYYIDNFEIRPLVGEPVGLTDAGIREEFTSDPISPFWAGNSLAGSNTTLGADLENADSQINTLAVSALQGFLPSTTTAAPAAAPRWLTSGQVSTAPTGVAATTLLASMINRTGKPITWLNVEYDLGLANANVDTPEEGWAGHRLYFSHTGEAGSWMPVGNFGYRGSAASPPTSPQRIAMHLRLTTAWAPDQPFFLLWVDDNAATGTDGLYTLDNVFIQARPSVPGAQITLDASQRRHISFPTLADSYYLIRRGIDTEVFPDLLGMKSGTGATESWLDASPLVARGFYRVEKYLKALSLDHDSDGMPDVFELNYPGCLDPVVNDSQADCDSDGISNGDEFTNGTDPSVFDFGKLVINEVNYDSPTDDDEFVEIYNRSNAPVSLANLVLVIADSAGEYRRIDLSTGPATLPVGGYLLVAPSTVPPPAGVSRINLGAGVDRIKDQEIGIAIVDTALAEVLDKVAFESQVGGINVDPLPNPLDFFETNVPTASDTPEASTSVIRSPNGRDTNRSAADWVNSTAPTPGTANP